ncbi:tetraspanin-18-like [Olea europaea var. sylvestris]|uniref:tetraspanin-18-like n=1 Tax=Olea europaea var. sylvestris TaxID=158386 RepID=UPI000C1D2B82|nr:tetraspanin-18-like [Olea europaea var. sylvestris]
MRTPCCHTFLAFVLKFLNFLQTFIGISIIIYSAYMLNQWQHHTPPPAPMPYDPEFKLPGNTIPAINSVSDVVFGVGDNGIRLNSHIILAPWFIYAFMGVGILICCITCIGHIAAEAINGCCLCFVSFPFLKWALNCGLEIGVKIDNFLIKSSLQLLDAKDGYGGGGGGGLVSLVAFIALDHQWEKDLPFDPTGELDSVRAFIEKNADVFMWVGISIITIQVLSLLLATILRSLVSSQRVDHDIEEDYDARSRMREPLLNPHPNQASGSTRARGDDKVVHNDIWSSRMREKYGLNSGDAKYNLLHQNSSTDTK